MTRHRLVLAALGACGVLAAPAAASTTPSRAALELSSAGKRALSARSISVTSVPRGPSKSPSFAIGSSTIGASAKIGLTGSLRFSAGKRRVDAAKLQVTISRTSSYVSARIGKSSVRLFTVTPTRPAVLDAEQQHVSLVGARIALTRAAASRLKSSLKLKRAPSTATLGKLTVAVARGLTLPPSVVPTPAPAALPAPAPAPAAPTPQPTATPEPAPPGANPCGHGPTPAGSVDWFGCDLPGAADLHSWTDYVLAGFPGPCTPGPSSIVAAGGIGRLDSAYDHRIPITSSELRPDGSATIRTEGSVTYSFPNHGIEESIGAFRIEIAPGGQSGVVYADGHAKAFDMSGDVCAAPTETYAGKPVLTLDLRGIEPAVVGGVQTWVHVPAKVAPDTDVLGGGQYGEGRPWGSFTLAVAVDAR